MLSSITPLGEWGRGTSWRRTVTAYIAGSTASGLVLGAALGSLGRVIPSTTYWPAILAALCVAGIAIDRGFAGARLPTVHRQVDERWLGIYRGWVYGFGYGVQLGLGAGTIVVTSAIYVMLAAELLVRSTVFGLVIGAAFGLVRGSTILLGRRADDPSGLIRLHAALERSRDRVLLITQGLLVAAGVAGVAWGVR